MHNVLASPGHISLTPPREVCTFDSPAICDNINPALMFIQSLWYHAIGVCDGLKRIASDLHTRMVYKVWARASDTSPAICGRLASFVETYGSWYKVAPEAFLAHLGGIHLWLNVVLSCASWAHKSGPSP